MAVSRMQMNKLLNQLETPMRTAILNAIRAAQGRANIKAMVAAIEAGDIDALLRASGVRSGMWSPVTEALRNAFSQAGAFAVASYLPKRFGAEFNINNPRAESWLRNKSSQLVTGNLATEQRAAIQEALSAGMARGNNPQTTALDIVGRISSTGRRQGGVIGLSQQQAKYANNAADDLLNFNERYFSRALRDKRFDSTVRKSFEAGKPLSADVRKSIVERYEDRLLKHRGDTIARTETLSAINEAQDEAIRQAVDEGLAPTNAVKRIWRHSFSPNEREGHRMLHGQERGMGEPFVNPITGAVMMYPGDGPASETINCRCYIETKIDFVAVEKRRAA